MTGNATYTHIAWIAQYMLTALHSLGHVGLIVPGYQIYILYMFDLAGREPDFKCKSQTLGRFILGWIPGLDQ